MPAVPGWFQATDYFFNKLAQMQATNSSYNQQELMDAFNRSGYQVQGLTGSQLEASAEALYRHFNDFGNRENVSPNNYFDVAAYKANKLAQVIAIDQTPPAGYQTWSEAALDRAMSNAGLSYWDHYIQFGTEEGINPSAAFDTNAYLADKLEQLNKLNPPQPLPDGSTGTWTREDLCQALRDADWNAVEHYMLFNSEERIGYEAGPETPAMRVPLTPGDEVISNSGISTNFVGIVSATPAQSTLNAGDRINGANGDALAVNMRADWAGFESTGFASNMNAVTLTNQTDANDMLNFNARNITGTTTWNVNGNVSLSELPQAGVTINLNGLTPVKNTPYELNFNQNNVGGEHDSLTLGLSNMPEYVTIKGNGGIEDVTVNTTGPTPTYVWLRYMDGVKTVKMTGEQVVNLALSPTISIIDGTESDADNFVCTKYSDLVESIKMGSGDNSFTLRMLTPDAVVDGGDGNDSASLYNLIGDYKLNMNSVETLNIRAGKNYAGQDIQDPTARMTLDGSNTHGFQNLKFGGGNGYVLNEEGTATTGESHSRPITFTNFDVDTLPVSVSGLNDVDFTFNGVKTVTMNVGDGGDTSVDLLKGTVNLPDATNVSINVSDTNAESGFEAYLYAPKATTLSLSNSQGTTLHLMSADTAETDALSQVSQLNVSGKGDILIDRWTAVGESSANVTVDATGLEGGTFNSRYTNNTTQGGATLDFTGSETGQSIIKVDQTYTHINITTGLGDDTLNLHVEERGAGYKFTTENLKGDLGAGNDTIFVDGPIGDGSNLTGLRGVESILFRGMTDAEAKAFVAAHNIIVGTEVTVGGAQAVTHDAEVALAGVADTDVPVDIAGA